MITMNRLVSIFDNDVEDNDDEEISSEEEVDSEFPCFDETGRLPDSCTVTLMPDFYCLDNDCEVLSSTTRIDCDCVCTVFGVFD